MNNMPTQPTQTDTRLVQPKRPKHLEVMAARLQTDPAALYQTLKATVFRGANDNEFLSLLVVANQYDLNPIMKQIYAFPQKGGGIVPIVSVDGWIQIINRQDQLDGIEFAWEWTDKGLSMPHSCTCLIYHKNRSHPTAVTEYYEECVRNSEPWKTMKCRMLRHKALIQCGRVAFGLSGIYDEDEARDILANQGPSPVQAPSFLGPKEKVVDVESQNASEIAPEPPQGAPTPEAAQGEPEAPETPPEGSQEAQRAIFVNMGEEFVAKLTGESLLTTIREALAAGQCSEAQLTAWARAGKQATANQVWTDMSEVKLKNVLRKWGNIGPLVKEAKA